MRTQKSWLSVVTLVPTLNMGGALAQCVKTVRWSDEAPSRYKLPSGEISGFNAELVRAALKGLHCDARGLDWRGLRR